jgi:hypothetical protein
MEKRFGKRGHWVRLNGNRTPCSLTQKLDEKRNRGETSDEIDEGQGLQGRITPDVLDRKINHEHQ